MTKGIYQRTESNKLQSKLNGKKQLGKIPNNAKIFVGTIFGKYKVLERLTAVGSRPNPLWKCICIECNEIFNRDSALLLSDKQAKECKCRRKRAKNFKGYEDICGKLWSRIQKGAFKRNLTFNIDIEAAWDLYLNQNRQCALTGQNLTFGYNEIEHNASLDRIDSSLGYEINNIQWIHKDVNMMKRNLNEEYFIKLCSLIYKRNIQELNT